MRETAGERAQTARVSAHAGGSSPLDPRAVHSGVLLAEAKSCCCACVRVGACSEADCDSERGWRDGGWSLKLLASTRVARPCCWPWRISWAWVWSGPSLCCWECERSSNAAAVTQARVRVPGTCAGTAGWGAEGHHGRGRGAQARAGCGSRAGGRSLRLQQRGSTVARQSRVRCSSTQCLSTGS